MSLNGWTLCCKIFANSFTGAFSCWERNWFIFLSLFQIYGKYGLLLIHGYFSRSMKILLEPCIKKETLYILGQDLYNLIYIWISNVCIMLEQMLGWNSVDTYIDNYKSLTLTLFVIFIGQDKKVQKWITYLFFLTLRV